MCRRTISVAHSFRTMYVFGVDVVSEPAINFTPVIWNNRLTWPPAAQHWYSIDDWFAFNSFNTMHSPFYTPFIVPSVRPTAAAEGAIYIRSKSCVRREAHSPSPNRLTWQPTVFYTFCMCRHELRTSCMLLFFFHFWRVDTLPLRLIRVSCRTERNRIFA